VLTFFQVTTDIGNAVGGSQGSGHLYDTQILDGWAAATRRGGWDDGEAERQADVHAPALEQQERGQRGRRPPSAAVDQQAREQPVTQHIADAHDVICVHGARENNLRNVSVALPKRRLTAFTGVSGSGKSSLVFATIAAESQRMINETY